MAVQVLVAPASEERKELEDATLQVIWGEKKGSASHKDLAVMLRNRQLLLEKKGLITHSLFWALHSIFVKSVDELLTSDPHPKPRKVIPGLYAVRLLSYLADGKVFPSSVTGRSKDEVPVTDSKIVQASIDAIHAAKRGWLTIPAPDRTKQALTGFFNWQWILLAGYMEHTPIKILRVIRGAMLDEKLLPLVAADVTFSHFFVTAVSTALHWIAGNQRKADNWVDLVKLLMTPLLLLHPLPNPRLGEITKGSTSSEAKSSVWLGELDLRMLTAVLVRLLDFRRLQNMIFLNLGGQLLQPVNPPMGWPQSLWKRVDLVGYRRCLISALLDTRAAPGKDTPQHSLVWHLTLASFLHNGSLLFSPKSEEHRTLHKLAVECLVDKAQIWLEPAEGIPQPVHERLVEMLQVLTLSWTCPVPQLGHPVPDLTWVTLLTPSTREVISHAVERVFVGLVLAEELLFQNPSRSSFNLAFLRTQHIRNHHRLIGNLRNSMIRLVSGLHMVHDTGFLTRLARYADDIASAWSKLPRRPQQPVDEERELAPLLSAVFADVLMTFCHTAGVVQDSFSPAPDGPTPEQAELGLWCLRRFFPFFGHTSLPPLPQPSTANPVEYQHKLKAALENRRLFQKLTLTTSAMVKAMYKASPEYPAKLSDAIQKEPLESKEVPFLFFTAKQLFLAHPEVAKKQTRLVTHILTNFRSRRTSPNVLQAAHTVLLEILMKPSSLSAVAVPAYLHICIPVLPDRDRLLVDMKRLPSLQLLRLFSSTIRGLCQRLEEWDDVTLRDLLQKETPSDLGLPDTPSVTNWPHPTGVGLVLYTVQGLKETTQTLLSLPQLSQEQRRQRSLYIASLVNMLKCLNPAVVTLVCKSLESVLSSMNNIRDLTFWLNYTSKAIKEGHNPSTKQQLVEWFLNFQSTVSPTKLGIRAKL